MSQRAPEGILAVVRAPDPVNALVISRGLAEAGVDAIEITFTVPDAAKVIARLTTDSGVPIGAGTVRSVAQCDAAAAAGATFIVSPDLSTGVLEAAHRHGLVAIPGALTPSEVGRCLDAGADAVKLYPVAVLGGATYVRTLNEPFPGIDWVVSGGIGVSDVAAYLSAGCRTICLGGALIDRAAAAAGDLPGVTAHAREALLRARAS